VARTIASAGMAANAAAAAAIAIAQIRTGAASEAR